MTPWKPASSTRETNARTRTDLLATRTGRPPARRRRSAALASNRSRSTTTTGPGTWDVARVSRSAVVMSARYTRPWEGVRHARDRIDLGIHHLGAHGDLTSRATRGTTRRGGALG